MSQTYEEELDGNMSQPSEIENKLENTHHLKTDRSNPVIKELLIKELCYYYTFSEVDVLSTY